jgi:hypothetical protein
MALFSQRQFSLGAPDCLVQCPVHQAGSGELAALGFRRRRMVINHRTVRWCIGLSGEPTVGRANGRPRNPRVTRGRPNGLKGAPDCPVRQSTEGKNCLPGMLSTTPSCLGAIKGTPRRMEKNSKHPLSIVDHSHSILAHLFDILSDLSSVLVRTS